MKTARNSLKVLLLSLFPFMAGAQPTIDNPIESDNITAFLGEVLQVITTLAIPVIVIFIIYAGFLFVTAGGDKDQISTAKKTAINTLIGAAIILGARLLADILINTAESLGVENLD